MSNRAHRFPAKYPVMFRQGPDMLSATICNISTGGPAFWEPPHLGRATRLCWITQSVKRARPLCGTSA